MRKSYLTAMAIIAFFTQPLLASNNPRLNKSELVPLMQPCVFGEFPEHVTGSNILKDIQELLSDETYRTQLAPIHNKLCHPYITKILLLRERPESCNPLRFVWTLCFQWQLEGQPAATKPYPEANRQSRFSFTLSKGSAFWVRKTVLEEFRLFLIQISQESMPFPYILNNKLPNVSSIRLSNLSSLPKTEVNIDDSDWFDKTTLTKSGWRQIETPFAICIPPAPPYPPIAQSYGKESVATVDVITDELGRPFRAKAYGVDNELEPVATEYVLGWLFDVDKHRTNECKWFRFTVRVNFILEAAGTPGPILARQGCIVGRKPIQEGPSLLPPNPSFNSDPTGTGHF